MRHHLGKDLEDILGYGVIVDADQRTWFRVDFETLVEAKRGADRIRSWEMLANRISQGVLIALTIIGHSLALRYLLQEVCLLFLDISWESFFRSLFDSSLDFGLLSLALCLVGLLR